MGTLTIIVLAMMLIGLIPSIIVCVRITERSELISSICTLVQLVFLMMIIVDIALITPLLLAIWVTFTVCMSIWASSDAKIKRG